MTIGKMYHSMKNWNHGENRYSFYIKSIIVLLLILFVNLYFFVSCTVPSDHEILYRKSLKVFDNEEIKHFPDRIKGQLKYIIKTLPFDTVEYFTKSLQVCFEVSSKELITEENKYKSSYLIAKNSDSCNIVIASNKEVFDRIDNNCSNNNPPIIDFSDYNNAFNNDSSIYLNDNYEIYVIEAKQGMFLDKEYLKKIAYLPSKWKHGCSRGIAINKIKKRIIYWTIIW